MKNKSIVLACAILLLIGCHRKWALPPEIQPSPREFTAFEKTLLQTSNGFGIELFRELAQEEKTQNLCVCPLSVSMALGMAWNGAGRDTKSEIQRVLGFGDWAPEQINQTYKNILDLLPNLDPHTVLSIANSIWYREHFPIHPSFIQLNQTFFYASVRGLDFNSPQAPQIINQWVNTQTRGKITEIIESEFIDPTTMLFLINAVYFKGTWMSPFDPKNTREDVFVSCEGDSLSCQMMHQEGEFSYDENETFQAVDLPYGNGAFSMTIFLPKPGHSIHEFIASWTETQWNEWISRLHPVSLMLQMPKFKVEDKRILNNALTTLGMGTAFDPTKADFSPMVVKEDVSIEDNLFIQQVLHKTFLEVDEKGTEAAGVTSISVGIVSVRPVMRIDRPFVCVIRETSSNTLLFIGRILRV